MKHAPETIRGGIRPLQGAVLAVLAAIFFALALPNELFRWGNPVLGLCALVPAYVLLSSVRRHGRAGLALGLFGGLAQGLSSYWLWFFKDFALWTLGSTILTYAVLYAVLGVFFSYALRRAGSLRPLVFALGWTAFELSKSTGFLGYPWGLLAYTWNTVELFNQIADITGVYGITFILAYANAGLGELALAWRARTAGGFGGQDCAGAAFPGEKLLSRSVRALRIRLLPPMPREPGGRLANGLGHLAMASLLAAFSVIYGSARLATPVPVAGTLSAVLVQQNTDSWAGTEEGTLSEAIRLSKEAIARAGRLPDIVVWNETNLDAPYADFQRRYRAIPRREPLVPFIASTGTYFLMGAPIVTDYKDFKATNSVILIGPDAVQQASYAKVHPVPFAEAIPLMEYDWFRNFMDKVVGLRGGWEMGTEFSVFELPTSKGTRSGGTLRFGTPICFEDAFADVCRAFYRNGADLLINLTNDSWSKTASSEIQHFVAARYRAIESRRTLVRSTNGGVTAVVDAYGRASSMLPLFEPASAFVEVPIYSPAPPTVYLRFGDWFASIIAFISLALILILLVEDVFSNAGRPSMRRP